MLSSMNGLVLHWFECDQQSKLVCGINGVYVGTIIIKDCGGGDWSNDDMLKMLLLHPRPTLGIKWGLRASAPLFVVLVRFNMRMLAWGSMGRW